MACSETSGCKNEMPDLEVDELHVFWLFKNSYRQFQAGMGGRVSLVMTDVESIARALGVPWCEYVVEGINACQDVLLAHDAKSRESSS